MINRLVFWLAAIMVAFFLLNCNKTSEFGAGIDPDDEIPVNYIEVALPLNTVRGDSVLTFDDSINTSSLLAGNIYDPVFGTTIAILYTHFIPISVPDFSNAELDSIVLTLAFDTLRQGYANFESQQSFFVFRLREGLSRTKNYYSNDVVEIDPEPLGEVNNIIPRPLDTVVVVEPGGEIPDTNILPPHIRIRLNDDFGRELIDYDSSVYSDPLIFLDRMKGLAIFPGDPSSGLVYFDLNNTLTAINVYYTKDGMGLHHRIRVTNLGVKVNRFEHDNSGTIVQEALNDQNNNDSVVFLQSLGGASVDINIPDLSSLDNKSINHAEIELYVAYLPIDDTSNFKPIRQLILFEDNVDNGLILVEDAADFFGLPNDFPFFFGGDLDTDDETKAKKYEMVITKHLQKVINGESSPRLKLFNLNISNNAARTILHGSGHSEFGAKLKVTYSDIN